MGFIFFLSHDSVIVNGATEDKLRPPGFSGSIDSWRFHNAKKIVRQLSHIVEGIE